MTLNRNEPPEQGTGPFLEIYNRYREVVRAELIAAGTGEHGAEQLLPEVFVRLMARGAGELSGSLDSVLRDLAREVAGEPRPRRHPILTSGA